MIPYRSLSLLSLRFPTVPRSIFLFRVHLHHKHQNFEPHAEDRNLLPDVPAMATVTINLVDKRQTQHAAAQGEGSTTKRSQSSSTQTSYKYRARGGAHYEEEEGEKENCEEEAKEQQRGTGPNPSLPNVAAYFARLVNPILNRIEEEGIKDKLYDKFMKDCEERIFNDLKSTYKELNYFYNNPTGKMPSCLSSSPPETTLYTGYMDMRLSGKELQIQQQLVAFGEELGFECLHVRCIDLSQPFFTLRVRLDVAIVTTTDAQTIVKNMLLALENV